MTLEEIIAAIKNSDCLVFLPYIPPVLTIIIKEVTQNNTLLMNNAINIGFCFKKHRVQLPAKLKF